MRQLLRIPKPLVQLIHLLLVIGLFRSLHFHSLLVQNFGPQRRPVIGEGDCLAVKRAHADGLCGHATCAKKHRARKKDCSHPLHPVTLPAADSNTVPLNPFVMQNENRS